MTTAMEVTVTVDTETTATEDTETMDTGDMVATADTAAMQVTLILFFNLLVFFYIFQILPEKKSMVLWVLSRTFLKETISCPFTLFKMLPLFEITLQNLELF